MSALAEILHSLGVIVEGSDTEEVFYTDAILHTLGIPVFSSTDISAIKKPYDCVIYSAAYAIDKHKQLQFFAAHDIPLYTYPQAIGNISQHIFSIAVAGVHGKTTISGMSATCVQELALKGTCIVGGQVHSLGEKSTVTNGTEFFLAETCEYRRHFLHFRPHILAVSNIELDHQDYYQDYTDIFSAFYECAQRICKNGTLVYCYDNEGARRLAEDISMVRHDIHLVPYGKTALGDFGITKERFTNSGMEFAIRKWKDTPFTTSVFGAHSVLNAVAATAIMHTLQQKRYNAPLKAHQVAAALRTYSGAKRRMEVVAVARGITIIDDYAHHPTAITSTLSALKHMYKHKRLIVDFMPHTYSRTLSLLDAFATSFSDADVVITHDIYPSAREENTGKISGTHFAESVRAHNHTVQYFAKPMQALPFCLELLTENDVFITMGAGDNWKLAYAVHDALLIKNMDTPS